MGYRIIEKKADVYLCEKPIPIDYSEVREVSKEELNKRINLLLTHKNAEDTTAFVIYGDREHFSNIFYFTNFDPRFEEALLIIKRGETPVLIVGNECSGYSDIVPLEVKKELFQPFSLMGQPMDSSESLHKILSSYISEEDKVGLIGWKEYVSGHFDKEMLITDVPYYIVKTLIGIVGEANIKNKVSILSDCESGLKHHASAEEIIRYEIAGTKISRSVYGALRKAKPGMTEIELSGEISFDGEPINVHPNINIGETHNRIGLASPLYHEKLEYGKVLGIGYGLRGSLVHKEGPFIRAKSDLPKDKKRYIEDVVYPYFACCCKWYEMMRIGTVCGDIYQMVDEWLGIKKYNIGLNPGHLIATDATPRPWPGRCLVLSWLSACSSRPGATGFSIWILQKKSDGRTVSRINRSEWFSRYIFASKALSQRLPSSVHRSTGSVFIFGTSRRRDTRMPFSLAAGSFAFRMESTARFPEFTIVELSFVLLRSASI